MIELKNINNRWGDFELRDISLQIKEGEYYMLLGPSGSGKTLLIETIAGIHFPEKGIIIIDNNDVTKLVSEKRHIGFVYQQYWLFQNMTVRQNILFGTCYQKTDRTALKKETDKIIDLFDLGAIIDRYPTYLSGGEQQRVAFARALAIRPKYLFLDEPFGPLDYNMRDTLKQELKLIYKELGVTIIHVTHDHTEAMEFASGLAVMHQGKIIGRGTVDQMFYHPENEFTARFLGNDNIFPLEHGEKGPEINVGGTKIVLKGTDLPGDKSRACIRPEFILVNEKQKTPDYIEIPGAVLKSMVSLGPVVKCMIQVQDMEIKALVPHSSIKGKPVTPGDRIDSGFMQKNLHLF
jgi:ABC-type Fe3+/spermidine/putrescine transport system ATPase subunit